MTDIRLNARDELAALRALERYARAFRRPVTVQHDAFRAAPLPKPFNVRVKK